MRLLPLLLGLFLPLCAAAQTTQSPTQSPTPNAIAVEDSAAQDSAIATRIRSILRQLEGYDDVTVDVTSGVVTLRGRTLDTAASIRLAELVERVEGVVALENEIAESTDLVERLNPAVARFRGRAVQVVSFLPLALIGIAVFAIIVAAGFALARMRQPWDRLAPNAFIADIYRQFLRLTFVLAGLVIALDILNATALLSGILGAAGIAGLAVGFAVRETVENFIASIMLSIRQPFRPNDTVEIEGDIGKVIRLTSRATILLSFDGNHIRIPNSTVFKSRIVNYSRNAERRFALGLTVAPDADLAQAQQIALDTVRALPFVLATPKASAWIELADENGIMIQMAAWIDQNETDIVLARSEAIRLAQAAFDAAGIAAPLPGYRVIHVGTPPGADAGHTAQRTKPDVPVATAQVVDARADKQLDRIVATERAEERNDLLRDNAAQE